MNTSTPYLVRLSGQRIKREEIDRMTTAIVAEARKAGLTWAEIGTALGVSKQAAQQRYGSR